MPPNPIVILTALALIATVLSIWGASLLYRALDGDRVTLRSSVKGRWTNRISRMLLTVSLLSILFGSLLSFAILFFVASIAIDDSAFAYAAITVFFYTTSMIILAWSWAGRRARGRLRRCPACSYDVSTIDTQTCPECGFFAQTPTMWQKPIKRKRGLLIGSFLALIAVFLIVVPPVFNYNTKAAIPTALMLKAVKILPDSFIGSSTELYYYEVPRGSLLARMDANKLTIEQEISLTKLVEEELASASNIQAMLKWTAIASHLKDHAQPRFSQDQAVQFVETLLGPAPNPLPATWGNVAPEIRWSGLDFIPDQQADQYAEDLADLAANTIDPTLSQLRWSVALSLARESDKPFETFANAVTSRRMPLDDRGLTAYFIKSLDKPVADRVSAVFWNMWLEDKNPAKAQIAIETMTSIPGLLRSWPKELESMIWRKTVDELFAQLSESAQAQDLEVLNTIHLPEKAVLTQMLTAGHYQKLASHIQADALTSEDIVILYFGQPIRPTTLTASMLTDLARTEDKLVRAAAINAIYHRIYFMISNPDDLARIKSLDHDDLSEPLFEILQRNEKAQEKSAKQEVEKP